MNGSMVFRDREHAAELLADELRARGWHRILLVSSPYHMRRAVMVWRKVAPDVAVTPSPPASAQFYEHTRGATLDQILGIMWEYVAIAGYWWRGYL